MLPTIKRQNNWLPTIFNDFFNDDWFPMRSMAANTPAINVKENDKAFLVEIAAPGMTKEDFDVRINEKDYLIISLQKHEKHEKHEKKEPTEEVKCTEGEKECKSEVRYLRREF